MAVNRYFTKGKYFAFYIDLLGQKDFYSNIPLHGDLQNGSVKKALLAVTHTITKVLHYSQEFLPRFIKEASAAHELNRKCRYEKYLRMSCAEYQITVNGLEYGAQQFSDSLLFYLRDDGKIAGDVFPFCIVLLARLAMEYFPNHIAFRGSVSYGDGWEAGANSICGPVLDRLVILEEKDAVIPRIVIDECLIQYCKDALPKAPFGYLSATNLAFTMLHSFYVDIDGLHAIDLWGGTFLSSLQNEEIPVHRDLLVASCKFVREQYRNYLDKQDNVSEASRQMALAGVAYKYAMAYRHLKGKLALWGAADIDFDKPMPEYQPASDNYSDVKVDLAEYTVIRLEFHRCGIQTGDREIFQSRKIYRTVRLLKRAAAWLSKQGAHLSSAATHSLHLSKDDASLFQNATAQQEIVISQIANVVVISIRNGRAASEYLMWFFTIVSVLILRLIRNLVFVKGSVVLANGWKVTDDCVCGPVMQRSYEFSKKLASSYRIVLDCDAYNAIQHFVEAIHRKTGEYNGKFPHIGHAVSRDLDGAYILNYIIFYKRMATLLNRAKRFDIDLCFAVQGLENAVGSGCIKGRDMWGFTLVSRYFEESCKRLASVM